MKSILTSADLGDGLSSTSEYEYGLLRTRARAHRHVMLAFSVTGAMGAYHLSPSMSPDPGWKTWEDAKAHCTSINKELAVIRTSADQAAFDTSVRSLDDGGHNMFWIGARATGDSASAAGYMWVDGTAVSSGFTNWMASKPTSTSGRECVEIYESGNYQWSNAACSGERSFVCSDLAGEAPPHPPATAKPPPPSPAPSPPPPSASIGLLVGIPVGVVALLLIGAFFGYRWKVHTSPIAAQAAPSKAASDPPPIGIAIPSDGASSKGHAPVHATPASPPASPPPSASPPYQV